ncbi:MAG TPA: histidinol-phosphate transaminase [Acidobacteriaceae bacterium]|nr:histidinol-phosphate transaminase [Acidobacteriaceae bacterium]
MSIDPATPVLQKLRPREAVALMHEYHPPLAGRDGLRLDFNENTFAPSPRVQSVLQRIAAETLTKYPERHHVERIVAQHFGLADDAVLLTNGVDEAIHLVCETYLEPQDEAVIVTPTFSMYALYAEATGARIREVQADSTLQFPYQRLQQAIGPATRVVMLASPNNPTGSVVEPSFLLELAAASPHAALLVDEAYYHFHGESVLSVTPTVPNLFVARTFSKAYGLAGLRIGLLVGHPDAMRFVRKVSSPYNVNSVALECLPEALADEAYISWYSEQVLQSRAAAERALSQLKVPYWPSHANFILMNIGSKHAALVDAMRRLGVLVRDRSNDPGCNGCVRITLGTIEHTERGLIALQNALKEIQWQPER